MLKNLVGFTVNKDNNTGIYFVNLTSLEKKLRYREQTKSVLQAPVVFVYKGFLASFLSNEEWIKLNHYKTYKRQIEWLGGRLAVKKYISQLTGLSPLEIILKNKNTGAPYLSNPRDYSVSISHAGNYAVCAIKNTVKQKVGIDLEPIKLPGEDFYQIAFSARELSHLNKADPFQVVQNWTLKEAYLKYIEQGFHENLHNIEVINNRIFHHNTEIKHIKTHTHFIDNQYVYSVVTNQTN